MGKPVIASPAAFEGVRAQAGRDLLVADDAAAFVALAGEVIAGHHSGIGAHARAAMEAGYAWKAVLSRMDPWLAKAG